MEQRKDIEELAKQIEELEEVRKRQSRKISSLRSAADNTESELQEKRLASENAVQALSSELRTTKNALETLKYREKQVRRRDVCFSLFLNFSLIFLRMKSQLKLFI